MAAPQSTPLPEAPTRGEAEGQFVPKANAFVGALEPFRQQLQAQADFVNERSTETEENAALAQEASEMALSSANFAGDWSGLSGAFAVPTSVLHDDTYWQLLEDVPNIQDDEPGVSDAWAPINVARSVVLALPDITALASLNPDSLVEGQQFSVGSYLPNTSTGSALLRWRPELPKSRHDGVLFFSLTVPMFTDPDDTQNYRDGVGETDPGGNGVMEMAQGEIIYNVELSIPTNYADWQSAVDDLCSRVKVLQGVSIGLRIESGHLLNKGLKVARGDFRHFLLTSEDPTVFLAPGFEGVSDDGIAGVGREDNLIVGDRAVMPTLGCLVDMEGNHGSGYSARRGSEASVGIGCGVINAGFRGIALGECSTGVALNSVWDGANSVGIRVNGASRLQAQNASANNCGADGDASVYISRASTLNLQEGSVNDALGEAAILCRRARANVQNVSATNSAGNGIMGQRAGNVTARGVDVSGAAGTGIRADDAGIIDARLATADNCLRAVDSRGGSIVNFQAGSAKGSTDDFDVYVFRGGTVILTETETSSGSPSTPQPEDVNIGLFNIPTSDGTVYGTAVNRAVGLVEWNESTNAGYRVHADGYVEMWRRVQYNGTITDAQEFNYPGGIVLSNIRACYFSGWDSSGSGHLTGGAGYSDRLKAYTKTAIAAQSGSWVLRLADPEVSSEAESINVVLFANGYK